jgi:uncharacterized phiE125 gp8 family phage protein
MPVSLDDAKRQLRVDGDDENAKITSLIMAAVGYIDGYSGILGRCIISQTWEQKFDDWRRKLRLPFADVASVAISYVDAAGSIVVVDPSLYTLLADAIGNYVYFFDAFSGPAIGPDMAGVTVEMVCGYGAAADVPVTIKEAILVRVSAMYEDREGVKPLSDAFYAPLLPYRRVGL